MILIWFIVTKDTKERKKVLENNNTVFLLLLLEPVVHFWNTNGGTIGILTFSLNFDMTSDQYFLDPFSWGGAQHVLDVSLL